MDLLAFLASWGFVLPWYLFGCASAVWVWFDLRHANTPLKAAMKWAWPIIALFFSPIGLALYLATARAPGIATASSAEDKKRRHDEYERAMWRRVNGAVIHCVAGDGLGIMTAMVIARVLSMTFWQEFWFEYAVGFAFGWFIFQYRSMKMMTDSTARALAMAFRAEFFSMLTVMGGMGAVMSFVTPMVVGAQPKPDTAAFWGFGVLGLLAGYLFTLPMNWMMIRIGWKHGMGRAEDARPVHGRGARAALVGAMSALGLVALLVPGVLAVARERHEMAVAQTAAADSDLQPTHTPRAGPVARGLGAIVHSARSRLADGRRGEATAALDDAMRAAQVMRAASLSGGTAAERAVREARRALQNGREARAAQVLSRAAAPSAVGGSARSRSAPAAYEGAPLVDASGAVIGELRRVEGERAQVAIGGIRDFWGFWDIGDARVLWLPVDALILGPAHAIGRTYAMLPSAPEETRSAMNR